MTDDTRLGLGDYRPYLYGPWGAEQEGACGCRWHEDPQGHVEFTRWTFGCAREHLGTGETVK